MTKARTRHLITVAAAVAVLGVLAVTGCGRSPYTYVEEPDSGLFLRVPDEWDVTERHIPLVIPTNGLGERDFQKVEPVLDLWELHMTPGDAAEGDEAPDAHAYVSLLNPEIKHIMSTEHVRSYRHDLLDVTSGMIFDVKSLAEEPDSDLEVMDEDSYSTDVVHGNRLVWTERLEDGTEIVHDDSVLVDWGNNVAYELTFSCDQACYEANEDDIAAIVRSLTVEEPE